MIMDIRKLQRALNAWNSGDLEITGEMDAKTVKALKEFQKGRRITQSGKLDDDTRAILMPENVSRMPEK